MLEKFFKKKVKEEEIFSPLQGDVIRLEKVPDPVFSQKMMGDGMAIIPTSGVLVSPVEGEIIQVFHTKHAIGIKSINGLEVLIHIGLETVELDGEGFEVFVKKGQSVKVGDALINFDIQYLQSENKEIVTPIIITNTDEKVDNINQNAQGEIGREELLFTCKLK